MVLVGVKNPVAGVWLTRIKTCVNSRRLVKSIFARGVAPDPDEKPSVTAECFFTYARVRENEVVSGEGGGTIINAYTYGGLRLKAPDGNGRKFPNGPNTAAVRPEITKMVVFLSAQVRCEVCYTRRRLSPLFRGPCGGIRRSSKIARINFLDFLNRNKLHYRTC